MNSDLPSVIVNLCCYEVECDGLFLSVVVFTSAKYEAYLESNCR